MNFSNPLKYSGKAVYSLNGNHLAIARGNDVIIYNTQSLNIKHKYSFLSLITLLEWSPDSNLLMIGMFKIGQCHIKAIDIPDWNCIIDEGTIGITYAKWAPDSRRILVICDFNIKLTVYSINNDSVFIINNPKLSNDKGICFSSDGCFLALLERKEWNDYIGIYFVGNWSVVSHFQLETNDAQGILWNKDNTALIIWDTSIENRFYIYSPTGNIIISHEPYQSNLGILNASTSPDGHLLAIGFYDESIRLYNQMTWKYITRFTHSSADITKAINNVFKEEEINDDTKSVTQYIECSLPVKLIKGKQSDDSLNTGIRLFDFSYDSNYLTTVNDCFPNVVWIWQLSTLSLHTAIIQSKPIKHFKWSPNEHFLIIGTESPRLYFFSLSNMYIIDLPCDKIKQFNVNQIIWNSDGKSYILCDKNNLIIGNTDIDEIN